MSKRGLIFFFFMLLAPLAYSASIKDLASRYSFYTATADMNVTSYTDFMTDRNSNGLNDTLVFELTTANSNGTFIFVIELFDRENTLTNTTRKALNAGINKLNITFDSIFLGQNQFNYTIKVYNLTYRLKYRKDRIPTQDYPIYERGFNIISINNSRNGKALAINITLNSSVSGSFEMTLFLSYNNSFISAKEKKSVTNSIQHVVLRFHNETVKRTHYIGSFNISSLRIGKKIIRTNITTASYDFRDFAIKSYISNFSDGGVDINGNDKYDILQINASIHAIGDGNYSIVLALHDLFGNVVETRNISPFLSAGKSAITFDINGSGIYDKKLNGPFSVSHIALFENGTLIDLLKDAYATGNYNFNDFESPNLPDLKAGISISDGYHYGINNITANFTFKNTGNKPAFNVFTEIFDNGTFFKGNKSGILDVNSQILHQIRFINISDFEISAIADLQDFVEELNESNNAERVVIKLNKRPDLAHVSNITANETDRIKVNLSATDYNGDSLSYSINLSKFSKSSNVFEWNTTSEDSGNYTLKADVSDGFLNDSAIFKIVVLDAPGNDADNDGIDDSIDRLIGNENSVNASTINLSILLGNSRNLSRLFNESMKVRFMDSNLTIAEFDFNFSLYKLNLTNVRINKQSANATGSMLVKGLGMHGGATKALYIDKINATLSGVCVKDDEINSISEISANCNSVNEFKVLCDGTLQNSYRCAYNSTLNKYQTRGLGHSGVIQIAYAKPESEPGSASPASASSSGSGGGGSCISDWQCSEWSDCINGLKSRECFDADKCALQIRKPIELQQCIFEGPEAVNVITPFKYADAPIKKTKQNLSPGKSASITGQAVMPLSKEKLNFGIFIVFAEVFAIVGAYLTIKKFSIKH